jgi:hypothetical protein
MGRMILGLVVNFDWLIGSFDAASFCFLEDFIFYHIDIFRDV